MRGHPQVCSFLATQQVRFLIQQHLRCGGARRGHSHHQQQVRVPWTRIMRPRCSAGSAGLSCWSYNSPRVLLPAVMRCMAMVLRSSLRASTTFANTWKRGACSATLKNACTSRGRSVMQ